MHGHSISKSLMLILLASSPTFADTVSVRADNWCPYNCEPGSSPGFGIELMQEALKSAGHTVDYKLEPWTRALSDARDGKIYSVVGAAAEDAKEYGLKIGNETIGTSSNCVFVQTGSKAKYSKQEDLNQFKKVGVINEYTYSTEFDSWIKNAANKAKIDSIAGDDAVVTNIKKLDAGHVDSVIEDAYVMAYNLKKLGIESKIISAGCGAPSKIYIAFSSKAPKVENIVKSLDDGLAALRKSGKAAEILAKYGVK